MNRSQLDELKALQSKVEALNAERNRLINSIAGQIANDASFLQRIHARNMNLRYFAEMLVDHAPTIAELIDPLV